jgi:hypothetical protein
MKQILSLSLIISLSGCWSVVYDNRDSSEDNSKEQEEPDSKPKFELPEFKSPDEKPSVMEPIEVIYPEDMHQCSVDSDCPEPDNECMYIICKYNQCTTHHVEYGVLADQWLEGDCYMDICNGSGEIIAIYDENDVHDDGDECTIDYCTHYGTVHQQACL